MKHRQIFHWFLIPVIGLFPLNSAADATVADASIQCSGLYYVLTALPHNPRAQDLGIVMGNVFKIHKSAATGKELSNSDMFQARDAATLELGELYEKAPDDVVRLYLQCNLWSRQVAEHLNNSGAFRSGPVAESKIDQIVLGTPTFPDAVAIPDSERQEIEQAIAQAFGLWRDSKRATRQSALEILRKELEAEEGNVEN